MAVSDKLGRKAKATAGVFGTNYGTNEALDIAADVYHGVSCHTGALLDIADQM